MILKEKRLAKTAMDKFGKIDILVNNAAFQNHVESIEELSIEQWDKTFKTNIYGYFFMAKAVIPHIQLRGSRASMDAAESFRPRC